MYAAILNKQLVTAVSEASLVYQREKRLNFEKYYCPQCQQRVILIISQCKMPFFKHVRLLSGQGEKEEHALSKQLLCASLVALGWPAQLEIPLAEQQLRADVLAKPDLAFEIQCAPLSKEEFTHRHQLYQQIKVKDIWIVGKRHYLTKNLRESQKIFLRHNQKWGFYYLEIAPFKNRLTLKYHIQLEALTKRVVYQKQHFKLDEQGLRNFFSFVPLKQELQFCDYQRQYYYLCRQLREKTALGQQVADLLYQNHLTINDVPNEVFLNFRSPLAPPNILQYLGKEKQHPNECC